MEILLQTSDHREVANRSIDFRESQFAAA